MKLAPRYLLATLILLLAACVAMEGARSFDERAAYAIGAIAAARDTAASMLERGRLTKEQGREVQSLADRARAGVDLATATYDKGDISGAEGQLALALSVLTALETYLQEHK